MSFDQIADMLTRIRNAQLARKKDTVMPLSKFKLAIAQVLYKQGKISKVSIFSDGNKNFLRLKLKYNQKGEPVIKEIKRISKQGCRIYKGKQEVKKVKDGYGFSIISTSKGLLTDDEIRKQKIGGEVICEIW
jgi:small subunit ribosomal protein S8